MRVDFPQLEVFHARARRERAEAVHRLIIVPIKRLFHFKVHPRKAGRVPA